MKTLQDFLNDHRVAIYICILLAWLQVILRYRVYEWWRSHRIRKRWREGKAIVTAHEPLLACTYCKQGGIMVHTRSSSRFTCLNCHRSVFVSKEQGNGKQA